MVPYEGEFIGVFRAEQNDGVPHLYLGRSKDAIHWEFEKEKIQMVNEAGEPYMPRYAYDPRLGPESLGLESITKLPFILRGNSTPLRLNGINGLSRRVKVLKSVVLASPSAAP